MIPQYEEKYFFIKKNVSPDGFGPISWRRQKQTFSLTPEMHNRKLIDIFLKK